jgi:hypothetical protein
MNHKQNCNNFLGAPEAHHGDADNGKMRALLGRNEATYEAVKVEIVARPWR